MLLHQGQELDNDLGGRADQDLALATLLSVVDVVEAVVQDGDADHFDMLLYTMKSPSRKNKKKKNEYQNSRMSVTIRKGI